MSETTLRDSAALLSKHVGEPFQWGTNDCATLFERLSPSLAEAVRKARMIVKDYQHWEEENPKLIEDLVKRYRLQKVRTPEAGDLILFRIHATHVNHLGVYLGRNRFIHAVEGKRVSLGRFSGWQRKGYVEGIYRWDEKQAWR